MSDPLVPNFKSGVGRLVTDRYDFEKHVDGNAFRHTAQNIDLVPTVTINGHVKDNLQDALQEIATVAFPPPIPDATNSVKGIIKLSNDLGGTSALPTVIGIQNKPINTNVPNNGDVLTFNGSNWGPLAPVNNFTAGGDLSGTNSVQTVTSISGTGPTGYVTLNTRELLFATNLNPILITQDSAVGTADGHPMRFKAQDGNGILKAGGGIELRSGVPGIGGKRGYVSLSMNDGESPLFQMIEPNIGHRVVGLCATTSLTNVMMPNNTGDLVMYVADTTTPPTTGIPSGGTIMYSYGGDLRIKKQNGDDFAIGSSPNPSVWGPDGYQTVTYRRTAVTTSSSNENAFVIPMRDYSSVRIDVIVIAKQLGAEEAAQYNMSLGFVRDGGDVVDLGTVTYADTRTSTGASGWIVPYIASDASNLYVNSGAQAGVTINWLFIIQVTTLGI